MIFFITFLRALGATLITNAHYVGVYPNDIIANGGLLGDVIFFAVSGFSLANIKDKFKNWYLKKIIRIYPVIIIITLIYMILGQYKLGEWSLAEYFIYPTYYHFVASIIVLYIPFYIVLKNNWLSMRIPYVILVIFLIQLILYIFFYDKNYYHIDVVREPMIRFLFFYSMLLGAYFRKNSELYLNKNKKRNWIVVIILFILYFGSKLFFVEHEIFSNYQIINQVLLFILLYFIFWSFSGIDNYLEKLPKKIKNNIQLISSITLEIYAVQYVIIPKFSKVVFPFNWIIITILIIGSAYLLKIVSKEVIMKIEKILGLERKL